MSKILFYLWHPFLWLISYLPLWILYRFADLLYPIILLAGYRKKVILNNLKKAFPEKPPHWHRQILRKFYRQLCDSIFEILKLQHISKKEIIRRVSTSNTHFIDDAFDRGEDVVAILAHYGNWEWIPSTTLQFKPLACSVYRPLKNKEFDRYMLMLRSRFGSENVTMKNTLRQIVKYKRSNTRFLLGLISDQSPAKKEIQYWTTFLNQPTPIIMGPEKLAKIMKGQVVYLKLSKVRRGHYHLEVIPYRGNAETSQDHDLTEWHVRLLEESIRERPELWLWSHKRWKYQSRFYTNKTTQHA